MRRLKTWQNTFAETSLDTLGGRIPRFAATLRKMNLA